MTDFLETVIAERRADAQVARRNAVAVGRSGKERASFVDALRARRASGRIAVIAEVKRRSPALGNLGTGADLVAIAAAYAEAGATAISVLTEPRHWGGSVDDLAAIAAMVSIPVLYKDIVVDEQQLFEAHAAGASAVLLIAEALDDVTLATFVARAGALGMTALVEAHEHRAFGRAVASGATVVGVNARNLRVPSELDVERIEALHQLVRPGQLLVAESGIATPADVEALPARVDAVLVGTALMRATDPGALVRSLGAVKRGRPVPDQAAGPSISKQPKAAKGSGIG